MLHPQYNFNRFIPSQLVLLYLIISCIDRPSNINFYGAKERKQALEEAKDGRGNYSTV